MGDAKGQQEQSKAGGPAEIAAFVVAKVGNRFLRFSDPGLVPAEGVVEGPYNLDIVREMTKDAIGDLYGKIAGVTRKNFKDKKIAIESLVYQIAKLQVFDPNPSPLAEAVKAGAKANKPAKSGEGKKYERKTPDTFELLQPEDSEKVLRSLAPQARELVLIMADLAKEKGSTTFKGEDLNAKLKIPEVAARIRTRQDPLRILQYYKGKLITVGLIRVS